MTHPAPDPAPVLFIPADDAPSTAGPARPPLSIVYLSASAAMGGAERALLDLLASLRAAEPEWRLSLVAPDEGPLLAGARELGVEGHVLAFPPALARLGDAAASAGGGGALSLLAGMVRAGPGTARYLSRLRALLAGMRPDVVHTNGLKMHLLGARAAPADARVVWHLHDFVSTRRAMAGLLRRSAARVDGVIAVSRSVAEDAASMVGAEVPVRTVYNAVDLDRFRLLGPAMDLDGAAGMPPAPPGTLLVGLLATMGRWKGHGVFLRAVAALPPELPVRAYVIGGGIYRTAGSEVRADDLRRQAAELGIADRVGFTGFAEDAAAAIRALDVVVHASTQPEPFGLVIAEAMACGRAVVASAAGGAGEIVTHGHDALAVAPGDVEGLTDAIRQLALDPVLRDRLGRAGRETAVRRFDRARLAAEVAPLYRSLVPPR
ncbi:MAG: glycosyltransferase family 4 protein [Gemmatimonadetes bacterium]|nr:glycosyltransferase family 4 protein [Gemmatimonadota bacterium]